MGRCAKRTRAIVKSVAKQLAPVGIAIIGDVVGLVETTDWTSDEKRRAAVALASGKLKAAGITAKEYAIRMAIEATVAALKDGQAALSELGTPDADDAATINGPD